MLFNPAKKGAEGLKKYSVDEVAYYVFKTSTTVKTMAAFLNKPPCSEAVMKELSAYKLVDCYNYVRNAIKESERVIGSRLIECALVKAKSVDILSVGDNFNLPPDNSPPIVYAITTLTTTTTTSTTVSTSTSATVTTTTTSTPKVSTVLSDQPLVISFTFDKDIVQVPLYKGFPLVLPAVQTRLCSAGVPCLCSPEAVLGLAITITHFVTIEEGRWESKHYNKPIIESSADYQHAATGIALELQSSIKLDKAKINSAHGMNLVNIATQYLLFLKKNDRASFDRVRSDIMKLVPAKASFNIVSKIGLFTPAHNPFEFTLKLLEACRAIRGGDDKDNTPLGSSYYLGVAIPRPLMKAFILLKDCNQLLLATQYTGIFFYGTKAPKKVHSLALLGLHTWRFGAVCAAPIGYVATSDGSGTYTHPVLKAKFCTKPGKNMLNLYFGIDPPRASPDYCAYEIEMKQDEFRYTVPSCAIHTMRGYLTQFEVNTIHPKDWLAAVRAVNVHRTFSCHSLPYAQLVERYPVLKPFLFKLAALGAVSRNLGVTFDQSALEGTSMFFYKDVNPAEFDLPPQDQPISTSDDQPEFISDSAVDQDDKAEAQFQFKDAHQGADADIDGGDDDTGDLNVV